MIAAKLFNVTIDYYRRYGKLNTKATLRISVVASSMQEVLGENPAQFVENTLGVVANSAFVTSISFAEGVISLLD